MSNVYDPMLATAMTKTTTVVIASIKGVAATSTPARNTTRDAVAVPAVTRTGRTPANCKVKSGESFVRAARNDPRNWEPWLDRAIDTRGRERRIAARRARQLNPLAPELGAVSPSIGLADSRSG